MSFGFDDLGNALHDGAQAGGSLVTGDVDGARAHLSDADSAITGDTSSTGASATQGVRHDATVAAASQARALQRRQELLGTHLDGEQDAQSVTNFENYAASDHPELYSRAQEMSSSGAQDAAQGWADLGSSLGSHLEILGQTVSSAIANGWEGEGAEAAAASSSR